MRIFHIVNTDVWEREKNNNHFIGESLKDIGFLHCCTTVQVNFVLNKWFSEKDDLVIVEIETEKLESPVEFEKTEVGYDPFPHIYGPINKSAVISVSEINEEN